MTARSNKPTTPPRPVIEAFSELAQRIHTSEDYENSLRRITETATEAIRGCDSASMSLLEKGAPVTHAATDQAALDADQIQYDENEGPVSTPPWNIGGSTRTTWPPTNAGTSHQRGSPTR